MLSQKTLGVVLLEITATTSIFLSYISEAPKIREFQVTSACPAAPSCAPRGETQPAFTRLHVNIRLSLQLQSAKTTCFGYCAKV